MGQNKYTFSDLVNLKIKIIQSRNKSLVGIVGTIILESKHMLTITTATKTIKVPKDISTYIIWENSKKWYLNGKNINNNIWKRHTIDE